jgi:hypothetical protein
MRNRVSTEFRKVDKDSDEYLDLQAQRDPADGRPVWEETGIHDAVEQSKRLENDAALPTDVGDADQPVASIAGGVTVVPASSVNEPLPSEVEAGAEQEEGGALFGVSSPPDPEVPLVAGMESPTDTDTSGTDESIAEQVREAKEPKDGDSESGGEASSSGGGGATGARGRSRGRGRGQDPNKTTGQDRAAEVRQGQQGQQGQE